MNIYIIIYIYIKLSYTIDIYLHIFAYPITVTVSTWKKPGNSAFRKSGKSARGKLSPPYSPPRKVKDKSQAELVPDLRPSHGEWFNGDGIYGDHGLMVKNRTMVFHNTCFFFFFIGLIVINMIDHG